MDKAEEARRKGLVGKVLLASAAVLGLIALAAYTGALPVPPDTRGLLAAILGAAAIADVFVGLWFIRSSQSS